MYLLLHITTLSLCYNAITTLHSPCVTAHDYSCGLYIITSSPRCCTTVTLHSTRQQLCAAIYHIELVLYCSHNSSLHMTTAVGCIPQHQASITAQMLLHTITALWCISPHWACVTMQLQPLTAYDLSCGLYISTPSSPYILIWLHVLVYCTSTSHWIWLHNCLSPLYTITYLACTLPQWSCLEYNYKISLQTITAATPHSTL